MRHLALVMLAGCVSTEEQVCDLVRADLEETLVYFLEDDGSFNGQGTPAPVVGTSWEFVSCGDVLTVDGEGTALAWSVVHDATTPYNREPRDVSIRHDCRVKTYDQGLDVACSWRSED